MVGDCVCGDCEMVRSHIVMVQLEGAVTPHLLESHQSDFKKLQA